MKYRKKPVIVEAYQTDKEFILHTLEGDMKASVGDYIITGVNGEQYPCKPDIFEKTYELVAESEDKNMPNSLRCKIKHLRHNGTLTERECDRILKALEQQPKVGKWIKTSLSQVSGGDFNRGFKCSCCGYVTVVDDFNNCPNCGARMGVDDNDIR